MRVLYTLLLFCLLLLNCDKDDSSVRRPGEMKFIISGNDNLNQDVFDEEFIFACDTRSYTDNCETYSYIHMCRDNDTEKPVIILYAGNDSIISEVRIHSIYDGNLPFLNNMKVPGPYLIEFIDVKTTDGLFLRYNRCNDVYSNYIHVESISEKVKGTLECPLSFSDSNYICHSDLNEENTANIFCTFDLYLSEK